MTNTASASALSSGGGGGPSAAGGVKKAGGDKKKKSSAGSGSGGGGGGGSSQRGSRSLDRLADSVRLAEALEREAESRREEEQWQTVKPGVGTLPSVKKQIKSLKLGSNSGVGMARDKFHVGGVMAFPFSRPCVTQRCRAGTGNNLAGMEAASTGFAALATLTSDRDGARDESKDDRRADAPPFRPRPAYDTDSGPGSTAHRGRASWRPRLCSA